ncbi:hypothetical protein ES708_18428 [subsurface metagenome]
MKENPIRTIRIGERLTQFEFSKILGVNQAQLSSYETGGTPTPPQVVRKISDIFKKDESELRKEINNFYEEKRKKLRKYFQK